MSCSDCCPLKQCNTTFTAPEAPCYPSTANAVIPSFGGPGYYCNPGRGANCGYRTLGDYGNFGNCCNPQVMPLCPVPCPSNGGRPGGSGGRPGGGGGTGGMVGMKEIHSCADGRTFTCSGGTLGCMDNSSMYCS